MTAFWVKIQFSAPAWIHQCLIMDISSVYLRPLCQAFSFNSCSWFLCCLLFSDFVFAPSTPELFA